MAGYLRQPRPIFVEFQNRMRGSSDLIIDGTLSIIEILRAEIDSRLVG